ncbi:hypothetical protein Poly51_00810 [Rubripirellula tenax]|uniref:Transcobalamin-like C-terminal domain-containing protein n=1 Tax=Rubripirellula tenax TaxID=2528015 RepID=A0A5C6FED5_9BACT|nr:DUF4430 domain-containing protein [Rubripirellula tenax]TWU59808.1 hypothetical protein Poly51_00810 [Rubripirellula tenax]
MRNFSLLGFVLIAALVVSGCQRNAAPVATDAVAGVGTPTGVVTIEIVTADGTKAFTVDEVAEGTTLEQVMESARDMPVEISGSGTTAFVHSLDGRSTSASEGWTYRIDGEFAHSGIGAAVLSPPTTVTWKFGDWEAGE